MLINSMLTEQEILKLQQEFYTFFSTGYEFEEFLKEYLIKMGLDEVQVTQRSRDGGVDLTAIRKGVGDFSEVDITHYFIQAKRNALKNKVPVNKVRELKGTIPFGYKGMLITTSDFSSDALVEARNDPSKPVIAINGKSLIISCIDHQIGFLFKPIFSSKQMDIFLKKNNDFSGVTHQKDNTIDFIDKTITANDIRARIISIPAFIMKQFDDGLTAVDVLANEEKNYRFSINKDRSYFGGVTEFLREYNLLSDGVITQKNSKWFYDKESNIVKIYILDSKEI